jgi:hypothetical protein
MLPANLPTKSLLEGEPREDYQLISMRSFLGQESQGEGCVPGENGRDSACEAALIGQCDDVSSS